MANVEKIKIKVSGRTFNAILNPESPEYPKGVKLGEPEFGKLGRGLQYRYQVTPTQLEKLVTFFQKQAVKNLEKGVSAEQREDGYAIKFDLERLEKQLAEVQAGPNTTEA